MMDLEKKPRKRRGRGASREELELKYPSLKALVGPDASSRSWVAAFRIKPEAMHTLLADFIKQVHAQPGRIGQRPMPKEEVVDFQALIYGDETEEPLHIALPKLMTGTHAEQATLVHMSRTQYQRMLKNEYHPDVNEMRIIASAVSKPPTYFLEYRKAMAIAAFVNLLDERPGIATALYRNYLEVRMGETGR
jgi:hypothetical protein